MATTNRQTSIFGIEDWKSLYQNYSSADFQSYNFETLRKTFVDYLRTYYPETFNDYTEASEYIALLDLMAFMGQSLAFRTDLNTRENFIDTAERRDSVIKLANLVNYTPKRNIESSGFIKVTSVQTTENVYDYQNINLSGITVNWNDQTNTNWFEQFITIINSALVNSQRFGKSGGEAVVNDVITNEYSINILPGYLPVVPFSTTVDGRSMGFEAVSATTAGKNYVYEVSPKPDIPFNVLYRNDQQGYGSINTGFFFFFKQGSLLNQTFNLPEKISNWQQPINIEGINETDVWLYQLDSAGAISQEWTQTESVYTSASFQSNQNNRTIYSVSSRTNDQINLNFSDGVFGEIPTGSFRTYVRQSNGLTYVINPEEMQNVIISLSYTSRTGKLETITFTCALQENVANSQARESLEDIRTRAPSRFYTQNRMVNGEDYDNFPYTRYNSIIKSQSVARSVIGIARNLDLIDPTGKYSSTNIFASDGALYENAETPSFTFTFTTTTDINNIIINEVQPLIRTRQMLQYYYNKTREETDPNLIRPTLTNLYWHQVTASTGQCTGYFSTYDQNTGTYIPAAIGPGSGSNRQYLTQGALVKFTAPAGRIFDIDNRLVSNIGRPLTPGDHSIIWAPITQVVRDGTAEGSGVLSDGTGPVVLGIFVPGSGMPATSAQATPVIPPFISAFTQELIGVMTEYISVYREFSLTFNNLTGIWSTAGVNDPQWLIKFTTNGTTYTVEYQAVDYVFASVNQCRFFYDGFSKVFDIKTGRTINDFINVLGTNRSPDPTKALLSDIILDIVGQKVEPDGYVNDFNVSVSFTDANGDGIADNPDTFEEIVGNTVQQSRSYVFLEQQTDSDDLERYNVIDSNLINQQYPTKPQIEDNLDAYVLGQVFYAYNDRAVSQVTSVERANSVATITTSTPNYLATGDVVNITCPTDTSFNGTNISVSVISATSFTYINVGTDITLTNPTCVVIQPAGFWELAQTLNGTRYLVLQTAYLAKTGRPNIFFQYRHNSPNTRRINPGITNIIDCYVVTNSYYTQYQNWIQDTTNTVAMPIKPTIQELTTTYQGLDTYKMLTDNLVLNSVTFKPLFGPKADPILQAYFLVVKNPNITVSDQEVKSSVVAALNTYFDISNWDFGQTFYFSELSAYLHSTLGNILSSVVLVPANPNLSFGNLYEIQSAPTEIFVNAATVNNVQIVASLTPSELRIATPT
jgi:hypothetical protein